MQGKMCDKTQKPPDRSIPPDGLTLQLYDFGFARKYFCGLRIHLLLSRKVANAL